MKADIIRAFVQKGGVEEPRNFWFFAFMGVEEGEWENLPKIIPIPPALHYEVQRVPAYLIKQNEIFLVTSEDGTPVKDGLWVCTKVMPETAKGHDRVIEGVFVPDFDLISAIQLMEKLDGKNNTGVVV